MWRRPSALWLRIAGSLGLAISTALIPVGLVHGRSQGDNSLYLPWIAQNYNWGRGVFGQVTLNGTPLGDVQVELRFFNGAAYSSGGFAVTDLAGQFAFVGAASLGPGQRYYVRYRNPAQQADGRLFGWYTRDLTAYTAGDNVLIGSFDITDFTYAAPGDLATVPVPAVFQWNRRPATPTDSYTFGLFSQTGPEFFESALLGYANSYTLNSRPDGFAPGVEYGWTVYVYGPDGGYGIPFYYSRVTFSN